ncbi:MULTISPECIES: APC family permease [Metallosphaera]|uniref:Amino acid/polyamine/organocation transporter, APC superfamily n=3 Tax=Metallosphaera TaxID=41980 RepID=A4YGR0_METS5|nr:MULTISPECIES: APC family permease [Metallosphaera]ABP95612.1 amino acid/polyamine/organocation transporter, APC superfamily [Metallosphaera sedula DSM 5348]AIM27596.1 amino acid/polyamine/organocation transporter, APC superfamily [Metallosphaera sedula]AKV74456.1 amino acid permease [Metallosphaera sedula]AKV76695.1 amino acid permease [Metallosphaera sedula]AKV78946.1 amino acid permease [Metallosphaera sedula]
MSGEKSQKAGDFGLESDKQLRRSLGKFELLYLSLGGIIGSGWLFGALYTAEDAGGSAILSWIIAGVLVLFVGLAYSELGSAIPKSGGIVRYPHYSHGGVAGYIITWTYFLSAASVPAIEATATVTYLSSLVPALTVNGVLTPLGILTAYLFLLFFFFLNYIGVNILGKVTHGAGWWKLLIPSITVVILLIFYFHPANFTLGGGFFPSASNVAAGSSGIYGFSAVLYAIPTTGVIFSYLGFRQAVEYGGEGRNPKKDIPFAVMGSLVIALILYTLLQVAFIGAINWNALTVTRGNTTVPVTPGNWTELGQTAISSGPFYQIFKLAAPLGLLSLIFSGWAYILLLDAVISPSGTGWIYTGTSTRTMYGFATNGYLPGIFLKVGKTRIPIYSLIAATIIAAIFMLPFPSWQSLVGFISSATVFTYIMGGIGLETLRKTAPELNRPYKLPLARVIAPIATLAAGLIVYWSGFATLFYVITGIFLGFALFFGYYAFKVMGINKAFSAIVGLVNIVVTLVLAFEFYGATSGLTAANNVAFLIYILVMAGLVAFDVGVLHAFGKGEDVKREITASYWLLAYIFVVAIISYFGGFGLNPVIPFPEDTIVAAVVTLAAHYGAVKSGFRTQAIQDILEETRETPP